MITSVLDLLIGPIDSGLCQLPLQVPAALMFVENYPLLEQAAIDMGELQCRGCIAVFNQVVLDRSKDNLQLLFIAGR